MWRDAAEDAIGEKSDADGKERCGMLVWNG